MKTRKCYGWDAPYSLNRTHNYENSAIHPRSKEPLGRRIGRAAIAQHYLREAPLLPILSGCSAVNSSTSSDGAKTLRLSFGGLGDFDLAEPVYSSEWPGSSGIEFELNDTWVYIDTLHLSMTRTSANGIDIQMPIASEASPGALSAALVTGVRYAWSDNPCCGSNNRTIDPCPPMSCPLLTTGSLPEPVVPFLAAVVTEGGGLKCVCDAPAVCSN
jgi:hypothetical protein